MARNVDYRVLWGLVESGGDIYKITVKKGK